MFPVDWAGSDKAPNAKSMPMMEDLATVLLDIGDKDSITLHDLLAEVFAGRPVMFKTLDGLDQLDGVSTYGVIANEHGGNGFQVKALYGGVAIIDKMNWQALLVGQDFEATFQRSLPGSIRTALESLIDASEEAGECIEVGQGRNNVTESLKLAIIKARQALSKP